MELEEAIQTLKDFAKYGRYYSNNTEHHMKTAINTVLNHLTKEDKMIESAKDRIEYYLMGNSTLNDFNVREKELEKLLNILKKAEESK